MSCGCNNQCGGCSVQGLGVIPHFRGLKLIENLTHKAAWLAPKEPQQRGLGFLNYQEGDDWWYYEDDYGNWYYADAFGSYEGTIGGGWAGYDIFGGVYNPDYWLPGSNTYQFESERPGFTSPNQSGGSDVGDWVQRAIDEFSRMLGFNSPGPGFNPTGLPGYCAGGTYHPYPAGHPQQDLCVPFPTEPRAREQAQRKRDQDNARANQTARQRQQAQQPCPPNTGLVKNAQGQCVCQPGYTFNRSVGRCVQMNILPPNASAQIPSDWWKWLLIAGAVVVGGKMLKGEPQRRRRK